MAPPPAPAPRPPSAVLEIRKDRLGFAAAHFSILETGSEPIHGHNYRVSLRADGRVRADGTVVDFRALKAAVAQAGQPVDPPIPRPRGCAAVAVEAPGGAH